MLLLGKIYAIDYVLSLLGGLSIENNESPQKP